MWLLNQVPLRMARLAWFYKLDRKIISGDMQIRMRRRAVLILAAGCALLAAGIPAQEIRDGETLLRAMHGRYQNNWYETLTFTQKSTTHNDDGTDTSEIWHEAMLLPGKLRIDIGAPTDGNGMLVANGARTSFQNGKASDPHPFVHMLLVLGFDVYRQPTQATVDQVKGQGFDLTKLREDSWDGESVYVVGGDKGDLNSKQFWVEKKRLLFVRMIAPDRRDAAKTADSRFADYRQLPVGWVAARVEFFVAGKNVFTEEYSEIQTNPKLDRAIFDPRQFNSQHWEK